MLSTPRKVLLPLLALVLIGGVFVAVVADAQIPVATPKSTSTVPTQTDVCMTADDGQIICPTPVPVCP